MGRRSSLASSSFISRSDADPDRDGELEWPFGRIDNLSDGELRETAYELFFMCCRSAAGFGGQRTAALAYFPVGTNDTVEGSPARGRPAAAGRVKRGLGLSARRSSPKLAMQHCSSPSRAIKRPMTSAEIMRQQMQVTELTDSRLRKTLARSFVGQTGRRAETIILPLELLRQIKPVDFTSNEEYHQWQRRQLRVLEAGLLLHPCTPLEKSNLAAASGLRDAVSLVEVKSMDTSRTSEPMRALCDSVLTLAWRTSAAAAEPACHWADGYPLNLHLYLALLNSVFDGKQESLVLDEMDELLELMKKTWSTLGVNKGIHNACFAWALLRQFVKTGQTEPELLRASLAVLGEINADWRRFRGDSAYAKTLSAALASILGWAEEKLLDYRLHFAGDNGPGFMEDVLLLALSAAQIIDEGGVAESRVDYYIRSSLRNAFTRTVEEGGDWKRSELMVELAAEAEELGSKERSGFSHVLRRWHPAAAAVAAVTLHNCYGVVLRQYLDGDSSLSPESMRVLQAAEKLEKKLAQIAVDDLEDCDDGGKRIVGEIVPFELDAVTTVLTRNWIEERLTCIRDCLQRAKDTETWNTKAKGETQASSAEEMMELARDMVDGFVLTPLGFREDMVEYLVEGLGSVLLDYTAFASSCGSRKSYVPAFPPLTRCNQDSPFLKLWKKAAPCKAPLDDGDARRWPSYADHPRPPTSRGTQRLYVRLNTLHYLLTHLRHLDKTLTRASRRSMQRTFQAAPHFERVRAALQEAVQKVAEVAACRLIFLDSGSVLYEGLYLGGVASARIRPLLRRLTQNLRWISDAVAEAAQAAALREVMKVTFEGFLMVLLAGGTCRAFQCEDQKMIKEDLEELKKVFAACGEGAVAEEVVQREAEVAEAVVALMGQPTEQLVEDLGAAACESACAGMGLAGRRLPMPPTTGKWGRSDANTILRVLCHRDDEAANRFLKKTFHMAKRR